MSVVMCCMSLVSSRYVRSDRYCLVGLETARSRSPIFPDFLTWARKWYHYLSPSWSCLLLHIGSNAILVCHASSNPTCALWNLGLSLRRWRRGRVELPLKRGLTICTFVSGSAREADAAVSAVAEVPACRAKGTALQVLLCVRQEVCSPSLDYDPPERETPVRDLLSCSQDDLLS